MHEFLAAEAGVDRHAEHQVHVVEEGGDSLELLRLGQQVWD